MGKIKIILGVLLFAVAAYFAVKLTGPASKGPSAPVQSMQPGPAPQSGPAQPAEGSMQDTLGLAGLTKGSLGTVKISEDLVVPESKLRGICKMAKKMPVTDYFPADKNPYITEKPELVDFVSMTGFGTIPLIDVSQAGAVLFSDDAGRNTGVWMLQFRSPETAAASMPLMRPGVVLRKGGLLMTFWHDSGISEACELAVRTYYTGKGFETGVGGPR